LRKGEDSEHCFSFSFPTQWEKLQHITVFPDTRGGSAVRRKARHLRTGGGRGRHFGENRRRGRYRGWATCRACDDRRLWEHLIEGTLTETNLEEGVGIFPCCRPGSDRRVAF
jgi:hypothetical protein